MNKTLINIAIPLGFILAIAILNYSDPSRKAIASETENFTPLSLYPKTKYKEVITELNYKIKIDKRAPSYRNNERDAKII